MRKLSLPNVDFQIFMESESPLRLKTCKRNTHIWDKVAEKKILIADYPTLLYYLKDSYIV